MYSQFLDKTVCAESVLGHPTLKQLHISFKSFLEQKKETVVTEFGNDTNSKIIHQSRENW